MFTSNNDGARVRKCGWTGRSILQRELEVCWYSFTVANLIANVSYTTVGHQSALCYRGVFRCSVCHLGIRSGFASTVQKPSSGGPMCQTGANSWILHWKQLPTK